MATRPAGARGTRTCGRLRSSPTIRWWARIPRRKPSTAFIRIPATTTGRASSTATSVGARTIRQAGSSSCTSDTPSTITGTSPTTAGPCTLPSQRAVVGREIRQQVIPGDTACAHVQAFDAVRNSSAERVVCGRALSPPPIPAWSVPSRVSADPYPRGLAGFDTWLWLTPSPEPLVAAETFAGVEYAVTATPVGAQWDFGDGSLAEYAGSDGFGVAYPAQSSIDHEFQTDNRSGYPIRASIAYDVTYRALLGGAWLGPYPM